jgi:F-type H+-transporting ATPase subunit delta
MIYVSEMCRLPEVKELLSSPIIVPSKKKEILHSIFGNDLNALSMSLVDLTVKNGREKYIPAIARVFLHETRKHEGITESVLTTAVRVDENIKKQVSELIKRVFKTKVDLKENIDESIIGGFILKVEDNYIDASVKNKLARIRKELTVNTYKSKL